MSPDIVVAFVIIFFLIGLAGMLWAWLRVVLSYRKNLRHYEENWGRHKERIQGYRYRRDDGKIVLKDPEKGSGSSDDQCDTLDPLDARCDILEKVLADANGACRLPELHDLNEYTLQRESASLPPSLLRITISFLLIVGIFGTLTGVEELLRDGDINIAELPKALRPSLFAVGGTVILLWIRSLYDYAFRKYLNQLNTFTVEKLIPALLPLTHAKDSLDESHKDPEERQGHSFAELGKQNRDFQNAMKEFDSKSIEALSDMSQTLREKDTCSAMIKKLNAAAEGITYMTKRLKENEELHNEVSEEHGKLLEKVPEIVEDIRTRLGMLEQLKEVTERITEVFQKLAGNMEGVGKQMKDVMEVAEEIPAFTEEMREYSEMLRQLCEMRENIVTSSKTLEEQIKELAMFDQSISEQIEKPARDALDELQDILQARQIQQSDFEVYLKGYDDEIKKLFASIQESVDDFEIKSCNDLAEALSEQTKKLGI